MNGADPSSVQVFMEDSAALTGVVIAGTCLLTSHYLMLPWIDSLGSITIGLLLSCVAVFLIKRNMRGLLNLRMDPAKEQEIVMLLQNDKIVKSIHDVKSTSVGTDWARFKAEILFDGREVSKRMFERYPHRHNQNLELLKSYQNDKDIEKWMEQNGKDVLEMLGEEIDRLECLIRVLFFNLLGC
jgi:zinc transporter 9